MVRTRSGKSTTSAEKLEDEQKVALRSPTKSPKKSSNKPSTSTDNGYQLLLDLCVWKPTNKTFTYWSCVTGIIILAIAAYSVYDELGTKNYPEFGFLALNIGIHCLDIFTNFVNEFSGKNRFSAVILFTESSVNAVDAFLFLLIANKASIPYVTAVALSILIALGLNIKFKSNENLWVRLITYTVFIVCVALSHEYVIAEYRVTTYFSLVFVSMIMDALDFPDKYLSGTSMCEGLIIVARSYGIYMLLTAHLLSSKEKEYTNFEYVAKLWIGIAQTAFLNCIPATEIPIPQK